MLNISLPSNCKYSTDCIFYVTKRMIEELIEENIFDLFHLRFPRTML